jgi:hypothetical protein
MGRPVESRDGPAAADAAAGDAAAGRRVAANVDRALH